jgi:uncharacterized protein (DUF433 family)
MSTVTYPHIEIDPRGVALLAGTTTKVIEIGLDYVAHHWDAEEIHRQHPHLSRGQIHSALAYFFDHRAEFDRQIAEQLETVDQLRALAGPSPVTAKLGRAGRSP